MDCLGVFVYINTCNGLSQCLCLHQYMLWIVSVFLFISIHVMDCLDVFVYINTCNGLPQCFCLNISPCDGLSQCFCLNINTC